MATRQRRSFRLEFGDGMDGVSGVRNAVREGRGRGDALRRQRMTGRLVLAGLANAQGGSAAAAVRRGYLLRKTRVISHLSPSII